MRISDWSSDVCSSDLAAAKSKKISEITVVVLDRPRHEKLMNDIRKAGARVKLISDGDVSAAIEAALPDTDVDMLMGVGGTPEGEIGRASWRERVCQYV